MSSCSKRLLTENLAFPFEYFTSLSEFGDLKKIDNLRLNTVPWIMLSDEENNETPRLMKNQKIISGKKLIFLVLKSNILIPAVVSQNVIRKLQILNVLIVQME